MLLCLFCDILILKLLIQKKLMWSFLLRRNPPISEFRNQIMDGVENKMHLEFPFVSVSLELDIAFIFTDIIN